MRNAERIAEGLLGLGIERERMLENLVYFRGARTKPGTNQMCISCIRGKHLSCEAPNACTCVHRKIHAERAVAEALAGVCCR